MTQFILDDELLGLDLETNGLDPLAPDAQIVGVGLANSKRSVYFPVDSLDADGKRDFFARLTGVLTLVPWITFNAVFDCAWLWPHFPSRVKPLGEFKGCALTLFRMLANEGYPGQSHSLETLTREVLGWPTSHKDAIPELLVKHGFVKSGRPDKAQMWRLAELEPQAFGEYCALDADAHLQGWQELMAQGSRWPAVADFAEVVWPNAIELIIEARYGGISVDRANLQTYRDQLALEIRKIEGRLRTHPQLQSHIDKWEADKRAVFYASTHTYKLVKITGKTPWTEPKAQWIPDDSTAGGTWRLPTVKVRVSNAERDPPKFNFGSDTQLRWLLYDCLYKYELFQDNTKVKVWVDGVEIVLNATDSGLPPAGKEVLPALGEVGRLLTDYNQHQKRLEYIDAYLAASEADNKLHPEFQPHRAQTGRLGGGGDSGVNCQQIPKIAEIMQCFKAADGKALVDSDFNSLEPKVATYFSQDPKHLELYASGQVHDIYLFVAMALFPDKRDDIAAVYYVDGKTTKDSIKAAKAAFPKERKLAKPIHLAAGYNAGPFRIWQTMRAQGADVTLEQVAEMHRLYWELFAGIKDWGRALEREREDREGWIYNGFGRPMAITDTKLRDMPNTFCQSTGHDALLKFLVVLNQLRKARQVPMRPWLPDLHDQTTWEFYPSAKDSVAQVFQDAYNILNAELQSSVALTGSVDFGDNFWEFKKD